MKKLKLAENVRFLRRKMKMTQSQLAAKAGFSQGVLSNLEQKKSEPRISVLIGLKRVFKMDIDELMFTNLSKLK